MDGGMRLTLAVMALLMASLPRGSDTSGVPDSSEGELPASYDPDAISAYFNKRPMMVGGRRRGVPRGPAAWWPLWTGGLRQGRRAEPGCAVPGDRLAGWLCC